MDTLTMAQTERALTRLLRRGSRDPREDGDTVEHALTGGGYRWCQMRGERVVAILPGRTPREVAIGLDPAWGARIAL